MGWFCHLEDNINITGEVQKCRELLFSDGLPNRCPLTYSILKPFYGFLREIVDYLQNKRKLGALTLPNINAHRTFRTVNFHFPNLGNKWSARETQQIEQHLWMVYKWKGMVKAFGWNTASTPSGSYPPTDAAQLLRSISRLFAAENPSNNNLSCLKVIYEFGISK